MIPHEVIEELCRIRGRVNTIEQFTRSVQEMLEIDAGEMSEIADSLTYAAKWLRYPADGQPSNIERAEYAERMRTAVHKVHCVLEAALVDIASLLETLENADERARLAIITSYNVTDDEGTDDAAV